MTDSEQVAKLTRQLLFKEGEARQLRKYISELERELAKRRAA